MGPNCLSKSEREEEEAVEEDGEGRAGGGRGGREGWGASLLLITYRGRDKATGRQ